MSGGGGGGFGIGGRGIGIGTIVGRRDRRLDLRHQPARPARHDERRRRPGDRAAAGPGPGAAERRCRRQVRFPGAAQHRGRLDRRLPPGRPDLPAAEAGAVHGRMAHRLRRRRRGDGAVLLPERPEGLHRPQLLRHAGAPPRRARRVRPGLRDGARGRPSRAEPDGHHAARRCAARAQRRGAGQRAQRPRRAAGRLLRRRLGAPLAAGAGLAARAGRHRGGAQRRLADRRRQAAAPGARPGRAGELHPRHERAAGELVQARASRPAASTPATPSRVGINRVGT